MVTIVIRQLHPVCGGRLPALLSLLGLTLQLHADVPILPLNALWSYQQTTNLDGVNWPTPGYDDSAWPSGNALLNVENNPVVSPRNTTLTLGRSTYYFRTHFNLAYERTNVLLTFSARIDDGAVFYLNGQEIQRVRMPAWPAPVYYTNLATATPSGGDATSADLFTLSGSTLSNLLAGDNVIAVEVHQNATNSDDIVFGSAITVKFTNSPPILLQQPTNVTVLDGRAATLTAVIDGNPTPGLQWFKEGAPILAATNGTLAFAATYPTNGGTYWLTATNVNGSLITTNVVLTVLADTNPPGLLAAVAQKSLTNIAVAISEPLAPATATNPANFQVYQTLVPSNRLDVTLVSLVNSSNVMLRTSARLPGLHYTLRVNGVQDIASVSNQIVANSEFPLSYQVDLIAVDAQTQWKFFQAGTLPATNWTAPAFDDSAWPAGAALFHAGSPLPATTDPVRTTLSLPTGTNVVTAYYFRTEFSLPGVVDTNSLRLRDVADDGAVFYLNGSEVFSIGMATIRPVPYAATATRSVGTANYEPSLSFPGWAISGTNLLEATNRFAAEVHQYIAGYADVAFAANVEGIISRYYPRLQWHLPPVVLEGAGGLTNQAQISILEPLATDLVVLLTSSLPSELAVPPQITIPAGNTNAALDLWVADDLLYNGPRTVKLTAQASQGLPTSTTLQLLDNETNLLAVLVAASTSETNGTLPAEVRLTHRVAGNITVALSSSDLTELTVPASVVIPNGATSAVFQVTVVDDVLLDGPQTVSLGASVPGWTGGQSNVVVLDDEPATITLQLPTSTLEGAGVLTNAGQLTLGGLAVSNLMVTLNSSLAQSLTVPTNVVILAGQSNAAFNLTVLDNLTVDADRVVVVTAAAPGLATITNSMIVIDNDPFRIRFGVGPQMVDTNTAFGVQLTAETATGAVQTNFSLSVSFVAEGLDGTVTIQPTNSGNFSKGQKYVTFQATTLGAAVRLRTLEYPGQSEAFNVIVPPFSSTTQKVADIAWHAPSGTIFASVPANAETYSNCIVAINSQTRQVTAAYPIGFDPSQIEMSPAGTYLYVALSNRTVLRRFDIATRQAGLQYPLGTNSLPFRFAYDFCVPPGMPDSVVVEARDQDSMGSQMRAGIWRYDGGKPISLPGFDTSGGWSLESLASGNEILLSPPLARGNAATGSVLATGTNFQGTAAFYRDNRIYDDRANVYSAGSLGNLGSYPGVFPDLFGSPDPRYRALVEVNASLRRVFFLSGYANYGTTFFKLKTYDRDLFQPLATFDVPATPGGPVRFAKCGTNGLAYCTGDGQLWFIVSDGVEPARPPTDLALSLGAIPAQALVGSNYTFTLTLSNAGPGTASLVRVTNSLPANVTLVAVTPSTGIVTVANSAFTWNVAALPAASNATIAVTLLFNTAGRQTNTSWALGFEGDPTYTNNVAALAVDVQLPPAALGAFAVNLMTEDFIYDPARDRLLLSVANGPDNQTNGIMVFNPHTGVVDSFTPLAQKPGKLARSDDGQYLYVSLPEDGLVRRLTLTNLTQNLEFSLGGEYIYGVWYPYYAADFAVMPGNAESLAAWRVRRAGPMAGEYGWGIALFDHGIMRSNVTASGGNWRVEFDTDSGTLFGYNGGDLRRCALDSGGVSFVESYPQFYSAGTDVEYASGQLFSTAGRIIEYQPFRVAWVVAGATAATLVEPDAAANRIHYLVQTNGWQIRVHELASRRFSGSIPISYVVGTPTSFIRWGTNGLAFRTSNNQLYVIRSPLVQPQTGADVALQVQGPATPVAIGSNAVITLTLTNAGPAEATGLQITNLFSPLVTIVSASGSAGVWTTNSGRVTWSLPGLPAGGQATLTCTINAGQTGAVTATATAATATADPLIGNNTALFTFQVGDVAGPDSVTLLNLAANDLVWSPALGRLLVTASNSLANWSGALLSVDPVARSVRFETTLGGDAGRLAISDDDTILYAGVDYGLNALTLPGLAITNRFIINFTYPNSVAYDLEVVPGVNLSIVTGSRGLNDNLSWLGVYDNGTQCSNPASFYTAGFSLEFGNDPALLYYQDFSSAGFKRYSVGPPGLTLLDTDTTLLPASKPIELKWADGLLYTSVGIVIDPVTRLRLRSIPGLTNNAPLCYDAMAKRVFYLMPSGTNAILHAVDAMTTVPLGTRTIPALGSAQGRLVRWGADGLACRTSGGQVALLRSALVPVDPSADLGVTLEASGAIAFVGSNFVYSVSVTNHGPNIATNAQIALYVPGNVTVIAAVATQGATTIGSQQALGNLGTLPVGAAARMDVTVMATQPGSLVAVASATSNALEPDRSNNSRSLTNSAVLFVARDTVVTLNQSAADLVFSQSSGRLYASGKASSIAVINPGFSQVETNWPVPSQPGRLALSDDGQALYVALNSNFELARLRTADGAVVTNFSLGTNASGAAFSLVDLEVVPGSADSVVVSEYADGRRYLTVLDNGVARPVTPQVPYGSFLEFGADPSVVYLSGLMPMGLSSNGVTILGNSTVFSAISNFKYDHGLFYTDAGGQVDAAQRIFTTRFTGLGTGTLVVPETARRRVYFLTKIGTVWQLRAYDPVTTDLVGSLAITNVLGTPSALTRWSDDGLAFCTSSNQVFLLRPALVPGGPGADLQITQSPTPPGPVSIGSNVTFVVQITNAGPAAASGVTLLNPILTNTTLVEVQLSQGTTNFSGGLLTCALGTITNGGTAQISLTLRPQRAGAVVNRATVTSANTDSDLNNNTITTSVGVQLGLSPDSFGIVDLQTSDIAYDPVSGLIYAALTNYLGAPYEQCVISIDPATGLLGEPLTLGRLLSKLAITDDGSRLYALANAGSEFLRLNLTNHLLELSVPGIGSSTSAIKSVPGAPESVVVGVSVYDNATPRTNALSWFDQVEFYAPNQLIGFLQHSVPTVTARLSLTDSGLQVVSPRVYDLIDGAMSASGGLIYTSGGSAFDPVSLTKIRSFGVAGPVAPDYGIDRVAFLTGSGSKQVLRLFDTHGLLEWGTLTVSNIVGTADQLIRCGGDRYAFRTSSGQVFIVRSSAVPTGSPSELALGTSPNDLVSTVGEPVAWQLRVTNSGPSIATGIIISNTLPAGMQLVSALSSAGVTALNGRVLQWQVPSLAAGEVATNQVTLLPGRAGIFAGITVLRSEAKDTNSADNVTSQSWRISNLPAVSALSLLELRATDLLFEPGSQQLFLSLPADAPAFSNSVVSLNPVSGVFGSPFLVGSNPGKLAASDNGQKLYVGLNGTASVARVEIATRTVSLTFPLNTGYDARDIVVLPGQPGTVAIAREFFPDSSSGMGQTAGIAIYRDGTELPLSTPTYVESSTTITCSTNPARLYGYNGWASEFGFRRFDVSSSGVTQLSATPELISGFDRKIEFAGGLLFASSGTVLQPEAQTVVTNIPDLSANALCKPDFASGRLAFLTQKSGAWFLRQYAHSNYSLQREIRIPGLLGQPKSLTRWGTDRLAFLTSSNQMFLVRPSLAIADLTVQHTSFPTQALAGQTVQISLSVSNRGSSFEPDAIITNTIPALTRLLTAQSSQGTNAVAGNKVVFSLGAIPANGTATILLTLQPTNVANTLFTNTANIAGAFLDAEPANNFSTAVFLCKADTDRDGLPDDWELARGLSPTNAVDAGLDSDCDGTSNLQEYSAGTDPFRFDNFRIISPEFNAQSGFELTLLAPAGKFCTLETSTNLTAWSVVKSFVCTGPGQKLTVPPVPDEPRRFFRLQTDTNAPLPLLNLVNGSALLTNPPILEVVAGPGRNYSIESSTNLIQWSVVTNYFGLTCSTLFVDHSGGGPVRFYRVVVR